MLKCCQVDHQWWTKTQDPRNRAHSSTWKHLGPLVRNIFFLLFPLDYIPNPLIIIRPRADADISTGASSDHICIWGLKSCSAIALSAPAQIPKQILYNLQKCPLLSDITRLKITKEPKINLFGNNFIWSNFTDFLFL